MEKLFAYTDLGVMFGGMVECLAFVLSYLETLNLLGVMHGISVGLIQHRHTLLSQL
jgi:hypothetical protein